MRAKFWLYGPLLPRLLLEGRSVRAKTPRLPEASGPRAFSIGDGERPLRIALIGESTAAGVGVERQEDGLGYALAASLHRELNRPVEIAIVGENGATLRDLEARRLSSVEGGLDLALIVIGVNDTIGLTRGSDLRRTSLRVSESLRARGVREIAFAGVPPIDQFTALPETMRLVLGARARYLESVLMDALSRSRGHYLRVAFEEVASHLAPDGFHPSATGYREWARLLAEALVARVPSLKEPRAPIER